MQDNYNTFIQDAKLILEMLEHRVIDHYEFVMVMILLKQTVLFKKKSDGVSLSQWVKFSGLSKNKIVSTLEVLRKKKIIHKHRQKGSNGGHTYSRYSLTLVPQKNKGSTSEVQGLVPVKDTQLTDHTSNQRESERFAFEFLERYLYEITAGRKINNIEAYQASIIEKMESGHKGTIRNYLKWKTEYKTYVIRSKHYGKMKTITVNDTEITGTIEDLKSLDGKLILSVRGERKEGEYHGALTTISFQSLEQVETILGGKE